MRVWFYNTPISLSPWTNNLKNTVELIFMSAGGSSHEWKEELPDNTELLYISGWLSGK